MITSQQVIDARQAYERLQAEFDAQRLPLDPANVMQEINDLVQASVEIDKRLERIEKMLAELKHRLAGSGINLEEHQ